MSAQYRCILPPDQASYAVTDGKGTIRVDLDGGKGRYRADKLDPTSTVDVQWTVGREQFEYLRSFFIVMQHNAAEPFKIELIIDSPDLTEHDAYVIPGSVKLNSQAGLSYTVAAQLEIVPLTDNYDYQEGIVAMWSEFGQYWEPYEDQLQKLINMDWPGAL